MKWSSPNPVKEHGTMDCCNFTLQMDHQTARKDVAHSPTEISRTFAVPSTPFGLQLDLIFAHTQPQVRLVCAANL